MLLGLLAAAGTVFAAQPPAADDRDGRSPRPPDESSRPVAALKYQVPNKDRAIFQGHRDPKTGLYSGGIIDFEPIATETTNKLEYDAWHDVTQHAAQFSSRELEDHAGRDATRDELIRPQPARLTGSNSSASTANSPRFVGFPRTRSLRESGTLEMYEALLVPLDEPPTGTIPVMFTELPDALAAVRQAPVEQWVPVDRWALAAGYFFKAVQDAPGGRADSGPDRQVVRVLEGPPIGPDPRNPAAIDKNLRVFRSIRNNAPIASGDENWEEKVAWNRVLLHARRFSAEELEENARTDLSFFDLYSDGRWIDKDWAGALRRQARLQARARPLRGPADLAQEDDADAGVARRRGRVGIRGMAGPEGRTERQPDLHRVHRPDRGRGAGGRVNKWVSFAGYAFKLLQYESGEKDHDDPSRNTWKRAPLLLGRTAIVRPDPDGAATVSWESFFTIATAVVLGLIGVALGMSWWFRRGDRAAQREIEAGRTRNPFEGVSD